MVYIRPGGSYVVARENFGPRIAQVCAVALLIDYVVTVAVQIAAGTAAVASAFPAIGPYKLEICVGVVLLMCFGNLRGLKEAGRAFAVPTYLFSGAVILMIIVGLIREVLGNLPQPYDPHTLPGTYRSGSGSAGLITGRDDLHPAARVRQRRRVADRHRGGLRRRRRVPAAGGPQRPPGAHGRGRDPRHPGGGHLLAGARHARHAAQERLPDRAGPGGPARLRPHVHRAGPVLRRPGRDHAHPVHRRQHQLQRLPVPDQLRGRRLVPAPVAAQARTPAGVLQRHHPADHHVHRAAGHQGRGRQQPGPAVRHRRVHRLLHGGLRHGAGTTAGTGRRAGGAG